MFGRKTKKQLAELDERLIHFAGIQADDHQDLQELRALLQTLQEANVELVDKVATLESEQQNLLAGLRGLGAKPSTPDFTIDDPALD